MQRRHCVREIALKLLCSTFLIPCVAFARPFAYVPNEKSGTVSIIDGATDTVVGEIKVGTKPRGLAIAGKTLFVSDQPANALVIVDLERRTVSGTVPLAESPEGVSASAAGDWVVAASEVSNAVSFLDTTTNRKEFSVSTTRTVFCARVLSVHQGWHAASRDRVPAGRPGGHRDGREASLEYGDYAGRKEAVRRQRQVQLGVSD